MIEPQKTRALPQRRRYRLDVGVFLLSCATIAALALLRTRGHGVRWEDKAEHLLGGNIHMFNNMGFLFVHLTRICLGCGVVVLLLLVASAVRHPRVALERAVIIGSFWVLCLISGIVLKRALGHVLGADVGTLPSGHTIAALSACGAMTFAAAGRWRECVVPAAGFMSSLYVLSVVNAYIHRPGDALTAIAVCTAWAVCVRIVAGQRRVVRAEHELSNRVLVAMGSAAALITAFGWGGELQSGALNHVEGWVERLVLTAAGGLYALYVVRVADILGGRVQG